MASLVGEKVPLAARPRPENYRFDLDYVLSRVVGLHSIIPSDGFTAESLGAERAGNGVVIDDGLVLTIGYLVTEASTVWLHLDDGRVVQGDVLGIDTETGFGLVQALGKIDMEPFALGDSDIVKVGDNVVIGGVGGRSRSVAGQIVARESFEGYWEYALDDALFTTPSHPNWGGSALISETGELVGIGSLQLERGAEGEGRPENANMFVPINLLKPVLGDLRKFGRVNRPVRPWLGIFSTELDGQVILAGVNARGPAARAELREGDVILAVGGRPISSRRGFYRALWSSGSAGSDIKLTLRREGDVFEVTVASVDRAKLLKGPRLH